MENYLKDLDVAVQMNSSNLDRLICAVEQLNLQRRVPVSLADIGDPDFVRSMVTEKGALVFSLADFNNPLRHLDIFLSPALSFERLTKGAKWFDIGDTKCALHQKNYSYKLKTRLRPFGQRMF